MKPPTKFENMRQNRYRADVLSAGPGWTLGESGWTPITQLSEQDFAPIPAPWPDKTPAEPPKQPTMTVDGVEYVEAPESGASSSFCAGCAFDGLSLCGEACRQGERSFGAGCGVRRVIYLKAS